jgi:hypothetical protein
LQISAVLGERVYVVKKSDTGEDMAHCKLCNTNFSVAAGALYDVKWHAKRSTHVTAVEASSKTKSITNFVDDKKSGSFERLKNWYYKVYSVPCLHQYRFFLTT